MVNDHCKYMYCLYTFIQQYSVIPDIHNEKKGIFLIQKEKNMYMEEKLY